MLKVIAFVWECCKRGCEHRIETTDNVRSKVCPKCEGPMWLVDELVPDPR